MSTTMIDPRPIPAVRRGPPRTNPILACEVCGTAFVFKKGNANRYCSIKCAGTGDGVHTSEFILAAARLWVTGISVTAIASALGVHKNVISGVVHRNRMLFPPRPSPIKNRWAA